MSASMDLINEENNNAVEQLLLGCPADAIATLLRALETFRTTATTMIPQTGDPNTSGRPKFLYSVDMPLAMPESAQRVFPFAWYGRPIAISSAEDDATVDAGVSFFGPETTVAVIMYNVGIAYQLECAYQELGPKSTGRRTKKDVIEVYMMALRMLSVAGSHLPHQQAHPMGTIGDRLSLGLLHLAILNNLLFVYAEDIDMEGVRTCLAVLCEILAKVCRGMPQEHLEDFRFFLENTLLFPGNALERPITLCLSPAA